MKITIIGGGISGLATAFWVSKFLTQSGKPSEVCLFEKNDRLGGCIDTYKSDNFSVEAGPNGFLDSKPNTLQLFADSGLSNNLLRSNDAARKRFIMRDNELVRLPESPKAFFSSKLLSFTGKIRVLSELMVKAKRDELDESVADFAVRRLGKEALDYLIGPMVSGIFAGDPYKMSLRSCFPVIYNLELEYGGLFKGMFKKKGKKSGPAGPGGVLTSYKGGLVNAINDLAVVCERDLGVKIERGVEVKAVQKENNIFNIYTNKGVETSDYVVAASPAYSSSDFLKDVDSKISDNLNKISYPPVFVAGLGFDNGQVGNAMDGFGYLIPAVESKKILGALFTSSIFPERVSSGNRLVRVIMGGDRNRWIADKSDNELVEIAFEGIKDTLQISGKPKMVQFFKWEKAIPQYYLGHKELAASIEDGCRCIGNLSIGGNVLYGIGINDCTRVSFEIAENIAKI